MLSADFYGVAPWHDMHPQMRTEGVGFMICRGMEMGLISVEVLLLDCHY